MITPDLPPLVSSEEVGDYMISNKNGHQLFVLGHPEYQRDTLHNEVMRDSKKGLQNPIPKNYYPYNDYTQVPIFSWQCHANKLFFNWLNFIYAEK